VLDANGQALVYARETLQDAQSAKVLTSDEARRVAVNVAKLAKLLGVGGLQSRRSLAAPAYLFLSEWQIGHHSGLAAVFQFPVSFAYRGG
jgi:hypothetical protein